METENVFLQKIVATEDMIAVMEQMSLIAVSWLQLSGAVVVAIQVQLSGFSKLQLGHFLFDKYIFLVNL